jgi:hypothetical protein
MRPLLSDSPTSHTACEARLPMSSCPPAQAALAKNQSGPRRTEATRSGEIQFHGPRGNTPGYSLLCSYCDRRATRFNKVVIAARKRFAAHKKELQGRQVEGKRGVKCTPRLSQRAYRQSSPNCSQGILPSPQSRGPLWLRRPRRTHPPPGPPSVISPQIFSMFS